MSASVSDEALGSSAWHQLAAEDLRALAWLHAEERAPQLLLELKSKGFPDRLALVPSKAPASIAMNEALASLSANPSENRLEAPVSCADELAADYSAIYLTHALRASPQESVWLDEDNLMLQGPTFAVRDFYRRHGIQATDWRQRADDHLVNELEFVALLLERREDREAALFLKTHLLAWLPLFAERVNQRAATKFYAALANLTLVACEACLEHLPDVVVLPKPQLGTPASGGCGI